MTCPNCNHKMNKKRGNYKYTESGLDNVVLVGITINVCKCGEKIPSLPDIEGLHNLIGLWTVKSKGLLTGLKIKFLRKELGLRATELAKLLGVYKVTVSRWETNQKPIGAANDRLLRVLFIRKLEKECDKRFSDLTPIFENISSKASKTPRIRIPHKDIRRPCLNF